MPKRRFRRIDSGDDQTTTAGTSGGIPDSYEGRFGYESHRLPRNVVDSIRSFMDTAEKTQQVLAREMGVSESRVSQILSGEENLTLRTLAAVAAALRCQFVVELVPLIPSDFADFRQEAIAAVAAANLVVSTEEAERAVDAVVGVVVRHGAA